MLKRGGEGGDSDYFQVHSVAALHKLHLDWLMRLNFNRKNKGFLQYNHEYYHSVIQCGFEVNTFKAFGDSWGL